MGKLSHTLRFSLACSSVIRFSRGLFNEIFDFWAIRNIARQALQIADGKDGAFDECETRHFDHSDRGVPVFVFSASCPARFSAVPFSKSTPPVVNEIIVRLTSPVDSIFPTLHTNRSQSNLEAPWSGSMPKSTVRNLSARSASANSLLSMHPLYPVMDPYSITER